MKFKTLFLLLLIPIAQAVPETHLFKFGVKTDEMVIEFQYESVTDQVGLLDYKIYRSNVSNVGGGSFSFEEVKVDYNYTEVEVMVGVYLSLNVTTISITGQKQTVFNSMPWCYTPYDIYTNLTPFELINETTKYTVATVIISDKTCQRTEAEYEFESQRDKYLEENSKGLELFITSMTIIVLLLLRSYMVYRKTDPHNGDVKK